MKKLFTKKELFFLKKLTSPSKIQDYLDTLLFNFGDPDTCFSPLSVVRTKKADCLEGALLACAVLWQQGEIPYLMNLKVRTNVVDDDHAIALYKKNGYWGAISKTNHAVLRFRDPIYKTPRELALSFFHEYFLVKNGEKTLYGYSKPINMQRFGSLWVEEERDLWDIAEYIYDSKHTPIVPLVNKKYIRRASKLEQQAASIPEYKK